MGVVLFKVFWCFGVVGGGLLVLNLVVLVVLVWFVCLVFGGFVVWCAFL